MTKQERLSAVFFIVLGIATIYYGVSRLTLGSVQEPGPGFFPALCGTGIIILCLTWFFTTRKSETEPKALWDEGTWIAPLISIVIITGYTAALEILGYVSSTFLFLIVWQVFIEREKWVRTGIIAVVGTAVMYLLFSFLLGVPLPDGLLI